MTPKALHAQQKTFEPVALRKPQYQDRDTKERCGNSEAFEGHTNEPDEEEDGDEHLSVLLLGAWELLKSRWVLISFEHVVLVRSLVRTALTTAPNHPEIEDFEDRFQRESFFAAQATLRGIAVELSILLIFWLSKDASSTIGAAPREALQNLPEIRQVLESQLTDRSADGRVPRAIIGRFLSWIFFFGESWLRAQMSTLFPADNDGLRRAAWRAHLGHDNALASSIVLVCRNRPADAPTISRRELIRELNGVLPEALDEMTKGAGGEHSPVAPVDLSQAIIGPGMAVFSKYGAVLEADGSPMSVKTALQLINRFLAEDDFDADTQFCLRWFEQRGWTESVFGEADVLARSKSTSVDAMKDAGVLHSGGGKVRLLKWSEYPTDWDPRTDTRTPVWEALHQLIRALKQGGESASGALLAALGGKAEAARQLAYRLYTLCERLGQAEDARAYNELITSWTGIESAAASLPESAARQGVLL